MDIKSSVFIATSLDGYIARPDGRIDWLEQANERVPEDEDFGYGDFIASVDVLVMGRNSFEKVLSFEDWPYGLKPVVVLSRSSISIPPALSQTVSVSSEAPQDLVARLAETGAKHLYIDGGLVIQSFLQEGLIDDLIITVIPILLGTGKPLFGTLPQDVPLLHLATKAYEFGFVQNQYRVSKNI
ncbi:MAG: dihydrofolate reductase family protein [Leptolyngbyaceae cyanobacterium bins.59]|nr:dihydrofolate reductase family protein [Leptolyngbyaceae cyanobacterium bins.59]